MPQGPHSRGIAESSSVTMKGAEQGHYPGVRSGTLFFFSASKMRLSLKSTLERKSLSFGWPRKHLGECEDAHAHRDPHCLPGPDPQPAWSLVPRGPRSGGRACCRLREILPASLGERSRLQTRLWGEKLRIANSPSKVHRFPECAGLSPIPHPACTWLDRGLGKDAGQWPR